MGHPRDVDVTGENRISLNSDFSINILQNNTFDSSRQIDVIFVVPNMNAWHKENLSLNMDDYSLLGKKYFEGDFTKGFNNISFVLVVSFVIRSLFDFAKYNPTTTSFPFYATVLLNALYILVPALLFFVIGLIVKKRNS